MDQRSIKNAVRSSQALRSIALHCTHWPLGCDLTLKPALTHSHALNFHGVDQIIPFIDFIGHQLFELIGCAPAGVDPDF